MYTHSSFGDVLQIVIAYFGNDDLVERVQVKPFLRDVERNMWPVKSHCQKERFAPIFF